MVKERIDVVLAKQGLAPSRERAKILIMAGEIYIGTERVIKPDMKVPHDVAIKIRKNPIPYVGYGGVKLEKAIKAFGISIRNKKAVDIGSSTGGFVDYLLKSGAFRVYAIDAGTHQLHESLRNDGRVIVKENFNARYLTLDDIGEKVDIVTMDVSFISLKKILPVVKPLLNAGGHIVSLVKPQFEVGRFEVGKGGIVKDEKKIERVIEGMKTFGHTLGLKCVDIVEAPREKERKNREYFMLWVQ
ncbi:MAG: TlyA family RNA methyltransferase [Proteobacteria bacterium]|nr:TlyA family RNA methyltransferase [Pseudomonadota bacterium]